MKINVLSDLHLSTGALEPPRNDADLVVLAGDIGRPEPAIEWARRLDKPVLYVAGNHEFYGGSLRGTVERLKALARDTNVQVLDDEETVMSGVRFLGSTLWSDFLLLGEAGRDAAIVAALSSMNDYRRIHVDEARQQLFTPAEGASLFARHSKWLDGALRRPWAGPTVVVTHHAPSPRSIAPRFAGSPLNACFASHAEHLLEGRGIALWVHGHMHDSFDYLLHGTRVVCNPRGYMVRGVRENPRFDVDFMVEVG